MSSTGTSSLRDLHLIHQRIARLRDQLDRGPRQLEAKRKLLASRSESLENARADLRALKVHDHGKETERKAMDGRIAQLQLQINTAKSNKEYTTLMSEKDTATKARGVIEDQILEDMMKEEVRTQEIQATDKEVARLTQELAELERTVTQQGADAAQKLQDAEAQLAAAEQALPGDARDVYRRLVERRGSDSLASVSNATCTGCYTGITPQMQTQVAIGELVVCKSCGRILYLEDEAADAAGA